MTTDVILIVTAGRGPVECRRAAAAVIDEIAAEAAALGVSVAVDRGEGDPPGSAVISLGGDDAAAFSRSWAGTVLWVDASARGRGGRKNWYIGVHRVQSPPSSVEIREADVRFETMRAGGPGGQHQNTTDSAVRATHVPTGLTATARDGRSQHRNKAIAMQRIRDLAAMRHEMASNAAQRREWLDRIGVERGNPVRTYRDGSLERSR